MKNKGGNFVKEEKTIKNSGITLIALVITIIVLLILTGISIQAITGTGLFDKTKQAAQESKYASAAEKVAIAVNASYDETGKINDNNLKENVNKIDGLNRKVDTITYDLKIVVDGFEFTISEYGKITGEKNEVATLPDNTKDTDAGTDVKLPSEWGTQAVSYIKTTDGTEVTTLETVATVYAVSDGKNNTVPVPQGFYYVGGNLETGVIISDNIADKYDGKVDKTTYEYTTNLIGNQFVWIPCSLDNYKKTNWNKQTANWDTTTPKSELTQIEKYGGFYVGRYEAGLASTISEFTTAQKFTGSNQVYNLDGIPQSKAEVMPWMFIDWTHSKTNAESMYNNNYVSSGLITGTQWDVILNTLINKTDLTSADITNSNAWGNYRNTTLSYNGRLAIADYNKTNSKAWTLKPFGTITKGITSNYTSDNTYGDLWTTGASDTTEKYHIFDLAGNLWEWTEENSNYATSGQYRVCRGGSYINASGNYTTCYRDSVSVSYTVLNVGFRVVLYIN